MLFNIMIFYGPKRLLTDRNKSYCIVTYGSIVYIPIKCLQQANNWEVSDKRSDDHVQFSNWLVQCDRIDSAVDTETNT